MNTERCSQMCDNSRLIFSFRQDVMLIYFKRSYTYIVPLTGRIPIRFLVGRKFAGNSQVTNNRTQVHADLTTTCRRNNLLNPRVANNSNR